MEVILVQVRYFCKPLLGPPLLSPRVFARSHGPASLGTSCLSPRPREPRAVSARAIQEFRIRPSSSFTSLGFVLPYDPSVGGRPQERICRRSRLRQVSGEAAGRVKEKTAPWPGPSLLARISPAIASTSALEIASPSPAPHSPRERALSAR